MAQQFIFLFKIEQNLEYFLMMRWLYRKTPHSATKMVNYYFTYRNAECPRKRVCRFLEEKYHDLNSILCKNACLVTSELAKLVSKKRFNIKFLNFAYCCWSCARYVEIFSLVGQNLKCISANKSFFWQTYTACLSWQCHWLQSAAIWCRFLPTLSLISSNQLFCRCLTSIQDTWSNVCYLGIHGKL